MNALLKKSLIVTLAAAGAPAVFGEPPKAAPDKPAPARSQFVMPANVREGRDPFFPESTRVYEDNPASKHPLDETSFAIKGISVQHGRTMVIINNHTFGLGDQDEGEVLTITGRVHIRLVEIRANAVVIEVNGSRRELSIPPSLGTK